MAETKKKSFVLEDISQPQSAGDASRVQTGRLILPQQQILTYSSGEWEIFIQEWVQSQKLQYQSVQRFSGPNDMGIDIAGFCDNKCLLGVWDNFQCKHYDKPLSPSDATVEAGKILWHVFQKEFGPPRKYYFIAPKGCGTKLTRLLNNAAAFKKHVIENWATQCAKAITNKTAIVLEGEFKSFVEAFDFSIFSAKALLGVVEEHRKTPYYTIRFGGGLPVRPPVSSPPSTPAKNESRYIDQLYGAYSDHAKKPLRNLSELGVRPDLAEHFCRHREFFYHAEALRNFARDTVPPGTFEDLQSEVYAGVKDVEAAEHADGYARLNAVTQTASQLRLTSNALISAIKVQDCKGICHQLANEDRLQWRKT